MQTSDTLQKSVANTTSEEFLPGNGVSTEQSAEQSSIPEELNEAALLQILEPVAFSKTFAQPRVKWYSLVDLPMDATVVLIVKWLEREITWTFETKQQKEFIIPEPLEDGTYKIRLIAKLSDGTRFVSRYVKFFVDVEAVTQGRITCPRPWDKLFILGKNRVRPCCNLKEGVIFAADARVPDADLWNNPGLVELRTALLAGDDKFCHPHCSHLQWHDGSSLNISSSENFVSEEYQRGHLLLDSPKSVKISLGSYCNHRCTFCKMGSTSYNHWQQTDAAIEYLKKRIHQVEVLTFTGGEPLLKIKDAKHHFVELFQGSGKLKLRLQTNAALLKQNIDVLSQVHHLELSISMAGATREDYFKIHRRDDFEKVCEGIIELKKAREEKTTNVELKMVYMRTNYKGIVEFAELAHRLGANEIYFHHLMILSNTDIDPREEIKPKDPEWQECLALFEECRARCDTHGINMRVTAHDNKKVRQFNTKSVPDDVDNDDLD